MYSVLFKISHKIRTENAEVKR